MLVAGAYMCPARAAVALHMLLFFGCLKSVGLEIPHVCTHMHTFPICHVQLVETAGTGSAEIKSTRGCVA